MYDDTLIPTDGSERAMNAVEAGLSLAAELGSTVHVLYVIDAFEAKIVPITREQDEAREEFEQYGEGLTGEVAEMARAAGVECRPVAVDGVTHDEIVRYVEDNDLDLVVVGSRGRSNIEEALLGSVANNVIRAVDVPVTVVHERPSKRPGWMIRGQDTVHG